MRFLTEFAAAGEISGVAETVRTALSEHKVVVLRRAPSGDDGFYRGLADAIGEFHFRDEDPVSAGLDRPGWLDIRFEPDLVATSPYRYGDHRMPLHVDGAYSDVDFDVFFLRCRTAARFGGATFVVDGAVVVDYLAAYDPDLLESLLNLDVTFVKGERSASGKVIGYEGADPVFTWSSTRVAPDNPARVIEMCGRFTEFCEHRLVDGGLVTPVRLTPGDAVFVHNRRVLHGRNSFWGERCMLKGVLNLRAAAGRRSRP
ncbi:TauD/TfdA family dioxygenase [Nocardia sp. BMG51109]|uniref:TauD/TfdA family dioxygenase n=1 Tax=Nocardia sp. BMG51109 TaxID=1056816 RepID=UPI0004674EE6|nr:TauD/TfdA family dioxygenase [Nocardia sp. BMG51109]